MADSLSPYARGSILYLEVDFEQLVYRWEWKWHVKASSKVFGFQVVRYVGRLPQSASPARMKLHSNVVNCAAQLDLDISH